MRALILLVVCVRCVGAPAGQPSTNQSDAWVFISSVRGGHPIVSVQRKDFPPGHDFFEFDSQMSRRWQTNYTVCGNALVASAKKEHLDSSSLAKILRSLRSAQENRGLAILPVAAQSRTQGGQLVWVVVLHWENARWAADGAKLVHVREFTVTQKTLKQIGFSTCG